MRGYFRFFPITTGKQLVWDKIVRPYILWRDLDLEGETYFGAKINVRFPDMIQARVYFFGMWEPAISRHISSRLMPGDTFIDIGSNIGYYSLLASQKVGATGKVFAIEASPTIYAALSANLAKNSASNVYAHNVAVCADACEVTIYLNSAENRGASTIIVQEAERRHAVAESVVKGNRLDGIIDINAILQARLIKIDVEGAEWLVIQGMRDLLPRLPDNCEILIEVNAQALRDQNSSPEEFMGIFRAAGFEPFEIENTYTLEEHWNARAGTNLTPYTGGAFTQTDLVFRKRAAHS